MPFVKGQIANPTGYKGRKGAALRLSYISSPEIIEMEGFDDVIGLDISSCVSIAPQIESFGCHSDVFVQSGPASENPKQHNGS